MPKTTPVIRTGAILFFFLFTATAYAQDITGIWRGHFRSNEGLHFRSNGTDLSNIDDRYRIEVQVAQHNKNLEAVTYSYLSRVFYGKAEADGYVDFRNRQVIIRELKIVELRSFGGACIMTCYLKYSKLGDEEFLEGTYTSRSSTDTTSDCGRGSIFLHKVPETDFYKEPFLEKREKEIGDEKKKTAIAPPPVPEKKAARPNNKPAVKKPATDTHAPVAKKTAPVLHAPSAKKTGPKTNTTAKTNANKTTVPKKPLTQPGIVGQPTDPIRHDTISKIENRTAPVIIPRVIANRSNELVKSITVTTPEVELNIYDDGTIDNDTVSVYYDNKLIVSKARLTDKAIVVKLHVEESAEPHELVMVAENLGDIPPNTSLMVVKAGEKRYEVRIVSTEQKNAVVMFRYEKPE